MRLGPSFIPVPCLRVVYVWWWLQVKTALRIPQSCGDDPLTDANPVTLRSHLMVTLNQSAVRIAKGFEQ